MEYIEKTDLKNVEFVLASWGEGKELLSKEDEFVKNFSEYDLSIRLRRSDSATTKEYLDYASSQVLNWTVKEQKLLYALFKKVKKMGEKFKMLLPKIIYVVQTTGEEGDWPVYIRGLNTIVIRKDIILPEEDELSSLINEDKEEDVESEKYIDGVLLDCFLRNLFNIYCMNNPDIKEKLCNIIGYYKTGDLKLPEEIEKRRFTPPDVIRSNYYFKGLVEDKEINVIPWFFVVSRYNEQGDWTYYQYIRVGFLPVNPREECTPILEDGRIRFIGKDRMSNYLRKVGGFQTRHTDYPEEILADKFVSIFHGTWHIPFLSSEKKFEKESTMVEYKMEEILKAGK